LQNITKKETGIEQFMDVLNMYEMLKNKVIKRKEPFLAFIEFLEKRTSWLTRPASTRYHLNHKGGLLKHSVGVSTTLIDLKGILAPMLSEESCVIVGLFHDVGKVGVADKPLYVPNENEWEREKRGINSRARDASHNFQDYMPMGSESIKTSLVKLS
jgi:23S rRNA maturation-related 3'-5' exoribonuclease YhaM